MSYELAMETAGAKILAFNSFGSYQGDWWAKVEYKGVTGWVNGSYGSCSGCDAFEAEFGFRSHNDYQHGVHWLFDGCEECEKLKDELKSFGESYLDSILTQDEAETEAKRNIEWDYHAAEMLKFIVDNR